MHALTIEKLRKTFENGTQALKSVDLTVTEGDFFALLGQNGAGKSTLIGIVTSLINKSGGSVKVFNHDITKNPSAAKSCMGLVPQEFNFYQFEKVLNIVVNQAGYYGIPRKIAFARAEQYLTQLGLWHKRHDSARSLSGGMKRRLMIARSLVHEPRMLILDEPTAGVDIELRRSTWEFLRELNHNGTTIILTTHYLEEAETLCNSIAIIDKGMVLEQSSMKHLLKQLPYERVVLDLTKPLTQQLPHLSNIKFELLDELTLELTISNNMPLNEVFALLSQYDIYAHSMRNKSNRLEELFLARIGKNAKS